ncbi:hypothetical protein D3C75_637820 [compost metagenome]
MDENIGEGRRRIPNVSLASKGMEHLSDETVDYFGLMLLVRSPVIVEHLLTRINGSVVCLVVDHKQRKLRHELTVVTRASAICHTSLNPIKQGSKNVLLLLNNKKPRPLFGRNTMKVLGDSLAKITVVCARSRGVGLQVLPEFRNANRHSRVAVNGRFVT